MNCFNPDYSERVAFGILNTSPTLELPKYSKEGDDGMDLRACFDSTDSDPLSNTLTLFDKIHPDGITIETSKVTEDSNDPFDRFINLLPGARLRIPTGIKLSLPIGIRAQVYPRSGLSIKYGVTVNNSPGKIDTGFHDCVNVILINHGFETFVVKHGDRIAQLSIERSITGVPVEIESIEKFNKIVSNRSDRGGGLGHTGVE